MAHTGVDAEPVNLIEACLVSDPGGELYLDLRSSLEPHLAALLTRHKEAAAKADWSCHQFLPLDAPRAHPRRHRPLSRAAFQLRKYRAILCKFAGRGDGLDARPESEGAAGTKPPSRVTAAP